MRYGEVRRGYHRLLRDDPAHGGYRRQNSASRARAASSSTGWIAPARPTGAGMRPGDVILDLRVRHDRGWRATPAVDRRREASGRPCGCVSSVVRGRSTCSVPVTQAVPRRAVNYDVPPPAGVPRHHVQPDRLLALRRPARVVGNGAGRGRDVPVWPRSSRASRHGSCGRCSRRSTARRRKASPHWYSRPVLVTRLVTFLLVFAVTTIPMLDAIGEHFDVGLDSQTAFRWALASGFRIVIIITLAWLVIRMVTTSSARLERELARSTPGMDDRLKRAQTLGAPDSERDGRAGLRRRADDDPARAERGHPADADRRGHRRRGAGLRRAVARARSDFGILSDSGRSGPGRRLASSSTARAARSRPST